MSSDNALHDSSSGSVFEESVEELYEHAPCGYLTATIEGRIVKVNRTLADWLGFEPADLTGGKRFADLLTVGGRIFYETHLSPLLRVKPTVDEIALDILRRDGRLLPALINARQKRDGAGVPVVNRFTIFNTTERRMYERDLLAARDLLRVTLASIGDAVVTTDVGGRINFMNPIAEGLSGWTSDAANSKSIEDVLILVREADRAAVENPARHALREGKVVGLANGTILISKSGRRFPVDDSASPIRDGSGGIVGAVLVFRDISERRLSEEREQLHREQVRETARIASLGRMAGGIAHDFNNLLTAMLGNASLLAESVSARDLTLVEEIVQAAERAAALTRQMLAYSGQAWLDLTEVGLNAHVRDNVGILQASLPVKANVTEELDFPSSHVVIGDAVQIQQIILNLLMNAVEALPADSGAIAVRTALEENRPERFSPYLQASVPAGMYVMIEVRDNGMGMSESTLKSIFDPFFTTKFMGRGLGLSAILGIVKAHSGDIEVISEPGLGSTFRVFLPAAPRAVAKPLTPASAVALPANKTILVVDDEEMIRNVAVHALESRGLSVLVAQNGREALALIRSEPSISAVILDLTMPVMSGEETLPLIRAIRPDLPVIISSGFSEAEVLQRFGSHRISAVLPKPYTVAAVVLKVSSVLQTPGS